MTDDVICSADTTIKGAQESDIPTKVDDEDIMDQLVQRASTPNLASLFQRGKAAGLIKPGKDYGN